MTMVERPFDKVRQKMVAARIGFMAELARFSKAELEQQLADEEWSPLRLAQHLYIADGLLLAQLKRVQEEDDPEIIALEEESPRQTRAAEPAASLDAVLAGMAARREALFQYLSQVVPENWERPCHHHLWGQMKFYQLVNAIPRHDQEHAAQLADLKARLG